MLNLIYSFTIFLANSSKLLSQSNTLPFSQQTPYSSQLIQTPYNSHNKHLQLSTHSDT